MAKLPKISKASKSNVILLKDEGYKNVEISKRFKLSKAPVSRILQRNKENLSLSSLQKRVADPLPPLPGRTAKSNNSAPEQSFISSSEIKRSMQELSRVTTRTIKNCLQIDFKLLVGKTLKKPLITQKIAHQTLEFCLLYKNLTSENWQKVMFSDESNFLQFAYYKPFVRRPLGSSPVNSRYLQPLSTPHWSWCGGAFPAKAEVVFISCRKDKQRTPHGILVS